MKRYRIEITAPQDQVIRTFKPYGCKPLQFKTRVFEYETPAAASSTFELLKVYGYRPMMSFILPTQFAYYPEGV